MKSPRGIWIFIIACFLLVAPGAADTVQLVPSKDNTVYEIPGGLVSNGRGICLFAGRSARGRKRAVMAFDLSSIPAGATVTSVTLRLVVDKGLVGVVPLDLHRLLADW